MGGVGILGGVRLESYELVILRRPADATEYDEETLERIQAEHLAFPAELRDTGQNPRGPGSRPR